MINIVCLISLQFRQKFATIRDERESERWKIHASQPGGDGDDEYRFSSSNNSNRRRLSRREHYSSGQDNPGIQ